MSLSSLRENLYNRILDARNIEYIIKQRSFEEAYESSTKEDQQIIEVIIEGCFDAQKSVRSEASSLLHSWIKQKNFRDVSIRDLRELARSAGVPKYSRLTKDQLLSEIARRDRNTDAHKNNSDRPIITSSDGTLGLRAAALGNCVQKGTV